MKIETINISDLTKDPRNARTHGQRNIDTIAASLDKFGQRKPIVVHNGIVIAGNGTVAAAESLGWTQIDVVYAPADWTEQQAAAFAVADNRSSELAAWDEEVLLETLRSLSDEFLDATGFSEMDIRALEAIYGEIPEGFEGRVEPRPEVKGKLISLHVGDDTFDRWKEMWDALDGDDDARVTAILDVMP